MAEGGAAAWKARCEVAVRASGQLMYDWDTATGWLDWGGISGDALGLGEEMPTDWEGWVERIHPDEREVFRREVARATTTGEPFSVACRVRRNDGMYAHVRNYGQSIPRADGQRGAVVGFVVDASERARMEEVLRQAAIMEVAGQLVRGVACDLNNILTVINGYSEVVLEQLTDATLREYVAEVRQAGGRAAVVTRHLASNGRSIPRRVVFDPNRLVADAARVLRKLLGEDIELCVKPVAGAWWLEGDPGLVDQVLLNLVVNARDAMPAGGTLTIETWNVTQPARRDRDGSEVRPGPYVLFVVSDTGCGMTEEVREHIFEPFFTTKQPGKGTGLGLATVNGIVRQWGGFVDVQTEVSRGTTFRVYLPSLGRDASRPLTASAPRGPETILVVETVAEVRNLIHMLLRRAGYSVLVAADVGQAQAAADGSVRPVDLLLADSAGEDERALAARLLAMNPLLGVIFMPADGGGRVPHGLECARVDFLPKPFTPDTLANRVRVVLDGWV